jgi:hypothetical protein
MSLEAGNWKWSSHKVCIFVRLKPELTPSQGVDAQPPSYPHFACITPSHLPCIATCSLPTLPCTKEDSRATTDRRYLASVMISLTLSASYIEIAEQVESFCLQTAHHIVSLQTANLIPGVACPHDTHLKALPARLSAAHSTTLPAILLFSHILRLHHTPGPQWAGVVGSTDLKLFCDVASAPGGYSQWHSSCCFNSAQYTDASLYH